jgi:RimJ/RimL family protein N-acetyltransferase
MTSMPAPFVPTDFEVPARFIGTGYRLEPLGPQHNERDYKAWTSSIDHIRSTPGFNDWGWPKPMTLDENLRDLEMHARHFQDREGFTYSILDDDDVIGCVYIYPSDHDDAAAEVRSWVTASRGEMDEIVWQELSDWLDDVWPFRSVDYASRNHPSGSR